MELHSWGLWISSFGAWNLDKKLRQCFEEFQGFCCKVWPLKIFSDSGQWPFYTPPIDSIPRLSSNWLIYDILEPDIKGFAGFLECLICQARRLCSSSEVRKQLTSWTADMHETPLVTESLPNLFFKKGPNSVLQLSINCIGFKSCNCNRSEQGMSSPEFHLVL